MRRGVTIALRAVVLTAAVACNPAQSRLDELRGDPVLKHAEAALDDEVRALVAKGSTDEQARALVARGWMVPESVGALNGDLTDVQQSIADAQRILDLEGHCPRGDARSSCERFWSLVEEAERGIGALREDLLVKAGDPGAIARRDEARRRSLDEWSRGVKALARRELPEDLEEARKSLTEGVCAALRGDACRDLLSRLWAGSRVALQDLAPCPSYKADENPPICSDPAALIERIAEALKRLEIHESDTGAAGVPSAVSGTVEGR
jgi:hypothetical protein